MANKNIYLCDECGYESSKWLGKCPVCNSWGSISQVPQSMIKKTDSNLDFNSNLRPKILKDIVIKEKDRIFVGIEEFDRVIGGGFVKGSLTLIGGEPGIGKSTIILQVCKNLCLKGYKILYISGEESEMQIKLRSNRIGDFNDNLFLLNEINIDIISEICKNLKPDFLIIDSIQTMINSNISGVSGSVSQVKESTSILMKLSKKLSINILVIGHVTKDGSVAGPKLLEHMVDTVLYFEGDRFDTYRLLRVVKNRFGATNEIGVFEMTNSGLKQVTNPSLLMLEGRPENTSGSIVSCIMEGTRPILIEIQALVSKSNLPTPRRTAVGVDYNRVNLLIAVIEKRLNINLSAYDVYVNVVGGMKIQDPSVDLPVVLSILSSYYNKSFSNETVSFGEIGLAGEIRSVNHTKSRIYEAKKIGFKTFILPQANVNKLNSIEGVKLDGINVIQQLKKL